MLRRRHYTALGLVVVLTVIILNLPAETITRLERGLGGLFLPLFGLANSAHELGDQASDKLLPRSELLRQNENLRRENQQLRLQAIQGDEALQENARLRQLVAWQRQQARKYKLAKVVLRDPANWWRTVQIDLGSRDHLQVNMPVLTPDGLVGRISSVGLTRSQVVLLGDPTCKVAARVDNEGRDSGIIGASGPLDSEFVELSYLTANTALKPGQTVRTSGVLGGIFPPGIPIGRIVDSHTVEYGLYTVARVKLAASLNALEEVWVMVEP